MEAIAGVEIAFLVLDLCEKIGGNPPSLTHPPAKERALRLRKKYEFPERYYELSDAFVSLGEKGIIEEIVKKYKL
jgi:hypothetical protein